MQIFKNNLAKNFVSLGTLQIVNFLIPLLLTPYLIRILGINNFGLISLAQAVISYFIIITDYGFNLTATRKIAINRNEKSIISEVFNQVISTKLILTAFGLIILFIGLWAIDVSSNNMALYLMTYSMVVGQAILPLWFFQGMEDMKYITFFSIFTKTISVVLILLFVNNQESFILVNLFHGIGTICAGLYSFYLIKNKFNVEFRFSWKIKDQLKEGWYIFTSNLTVNICTNSNIIILGLFASKEIVGYYSIAEKVINTTRQILVVYFQVIYPHVCNLATNSKELLLGFFKRAFVPFAILILLLSISIFFLASYIVYFFTGETNNDIALIIRVLSMVPLIVALNIPAHQLLLAYNQKKLYSAIFIIGAIANLGINSILSYYYKALGTAFAVVITEFIITYCMYLVVYKQKLYNTPQGTEH